MFKKKDSKANERVIYQTRPNLILGCKKAILGFILLAVVLGASGPIIKFIGEMQVYLISRVKLSLTSYTAIALFVVILIIIIYIIWQILGWYSKEYVLTDSKIMVKSGVLLTKKNYMPYSTVQDINVSQSIFARILNVGSVSIFSAYDNNQMVLENIHDPSGIEEIIFSRITNPGRFNPYPNRQAYTDQDNYHRNAFNNPEAGYAPRQRNPDDYYMDMQEDYEDDYVAITPIQHEEQYQPRKYDYYPEDLNYNNANQRPRYEYAPYEQNLENNINRAMNDYDAPNDYRQENYYEEPRQDFANVNEDNHFNNERKSHRNKKDSSKRDKKTDESSESVIKRHFDKFKN